MSRKAGEKYTAASGRPGKALTPEDAVLVRKIKFASSTRLSKFICALAFTPSTHPEGVAPSCCRTVSPWRPHPGGGADKLPKPRGRSRFRGGKDMVAKIQAEKSTDYATIATPHDAHGAAR
jgi:hypothetical protein